ncbi:MULTISPECIES: GNAT family N-acetyltransferase [unclassified Synechococcus]|uniref:GNAT family N-acetyltransferase n=1 Tax=unclassified Synechococcus TaxID=2626047 RepID=UPI001CF80FD5|nr:MULTISPECIES: GNAT family N-acetyltransferase [unclassified Synechococcus]MCB4411100.1 N-acetyltransferase [Synechococcus sp. MU1611]
MTSLTARWHRSINEITEQQWNSLVGDDAIPFYRWSWLEALESSGSTIPDQGWQPLHLALWRDDSPIAVAPLFLKGHSYGEFVFDQTFARLAADLGLHYYPKLLGMSPVSPVLGYRFHVRAGEDEALLTRELLRAIDRFCEQNGILSCNFLYVDPQWRPLAESGGCAAWLNQQSLWSRGDDQSFEDYLKGFNANQRRNIKRERKAVAKAGITVTPLSGDQLDLKLLQTMHRFYEQHCARWGPWGSKYLEEGFFEALARLHRDQLVLFSAHRGDPHDPVAMSMCVQDGRQLWGRYWGSNEEIDCLHFEVCYYAPIEWALANNITSFDPGAGGSHKRRRGFVARPHASLHRWYQPQMDQLIRTWLPKVNGLMLEEIEAINAELPFKAEPPALAL